VLKMEAENPDEWAVLDELEQQDLSTFQSNF
jgi:hypothetical protein